MLVLNHENHEKWQPHFGWANIFRLRLVWIKILISYVNGEKIASFESILPTTFVFVYPKDQPPQVGLYYFNNINLWVKAKATPDQFQGLVMVQHEDVVVVFGN